MIKPLKDNIVAVMLDDPDRAGALFIPKNQSQAMLQNVRALVVASGPVAREGGVEPGVIIYCSEVWGDKLTLGNKEYKIGKLRHIIGICPEERVKDVNRYLD